MPSRGTGRRTENRRYLHDPIIENPLHITPHQPPGAKSSQGAHRRNVADRVTNQTAGVERPHSKPFGRLVFMAFGNLQFLF